MVARSLPPWTLLVGILIGALVLRLWGIGFGLDVGAPVTFSYHLDEPKLLTRALHVARSGDLDPRWFHYPSLQLYAIAAALAAAPAGWDPYLVSRALTALFGAVSVLVLFALTRRIEGTRAGLFAALLLAVSFLHVRSSHYVTTDVPMTFWALVSALFTLRFLDARQTGRFPNLALAFVAAGFAAGTKYNGASILAVPALGALLGRPGHRGTQRLVHVTVGVLIAAASFVLTTPFLVVHPDSFQSWFNYLHEFQQRGQFGFERPGWLWNLDYLSRYLFRWAIGPLAATLAVAGAALALRGSRWRCALPLVAFAGAHLVWLATYRTSYPRNAMVLVPIAALFAGVAAHRALRFVESRQRPSRVLAWALALALAGALIAVPLGDSIRLDRSFAGSTRTRSAPWFEENLPPGSRVLVEVYGPPLEIIHPGRWEVQPIWNLGQGLPNVRWLRGQGIDFVISSSGASQMVFANPGRYPRAERNYRDLERTCTLMQTFEGNLQDPLFSSVSPTLKVYDCRASGRATPMP